MSEWANKSEWILYYYCYYYTSCYIVAHSHFMDKSHCVLWLISLARNVKMVYRRLLVCACVCFSPFSSFISFSWAVLSFAMLRAYHCARNKENPLKGVFWSSVGWINFPCFTKTHSHWMRTDCEHCQVREGKREK